MVKVDSYTIIKVNDDLCSTKKNINITVRGKNDKLISSFWKSFKLERWMSCKLL